MVADAHFQRGLLLLGQGRAALAETEFRAALAQNPQDASAHAQLATALLMQERFDEAEQEAKQAIGLDPLEPRVHRVLGYLLLQRRRYGEAAAAAAEAVRLDPDDAANHELTARIALANSKPAVALSAIEQGLALAPEDADLNNLRAEALILMGRRDEAGRTLEAALQRDPENTDTHANLGWAHMHAGEHLKAAEHFREALRLDPDNDWARYGMVESLKARNPFYALFLRYFLWMSRQTHTMQLGVVIAVYFSQRAVFSVARHQPHLEPFLYPLGLAMSVLVLSTWLAQPVFNLLLRLDTFGRYVLSDEERRATSWLAPCLALMLAAPLALGLTLGSGQLMFLLGLMLAVATTIVAAVWRVPSGWPRKVMAAVAGGVWLFAFGSLVTLLALLVQGPELSDAHQKALLASGFGLGTLALYGGIGGQLLANILSGATVTR